MWKEGFDSEPDCVSRHFPVPARFWACAARRCRWLVENGSLQDEPLGPACSGSSVRGTPSCFPYKWPPGLHIQGSSRYSRVLGGGGVLKLACRGSKPLLPPNSCAALAHCLHLSEPVPPPVKWRRVIVRSLELARALYLIRLSLRMVLVYSLVTLLCL